MKKTRLRKTGTLPLDLLSRILCCLLNYHRPRRHWIGASKHEGNQTRYGRSPRLEEPRSAASVSFRASNHEPSIMKPEASGYRRGMARHGAVTQSPPPWFFLASSAARRSPFPGRNAIPLARQYDSYFWKSSGSQYSQPVRNLLRIACNTLVAVISRFWLTVHFICDFDQSIAIIHAY